MNAIRLLSICFALCLGGVVWAQGTAVPFGGMKVNPDQPVEITAESLSVDQTDGSAIFKGNVVIGQGEMRLNAQKVRVEYGREGTPQDGKITKVFASGGVTLVSGSEAAEAQQADYDIENGVVIMIGSVIITQGRNAISAERARINLTTGQANLEGKVRTILQTGNN